MDSAIGNRENAPETPASPGDPLTDAVGIGTGRPASPRRFCAGGRIERGSSARSTAGQ